MSLEREPRLVFNIVWWNLQNYLAPLQCPLKNKNGCQAGGKATEETVSKYAVFCTKFLRCAIETLKKVKANQKGLFEVTDALKLGKMKHVNILSCCLGVRSFVACENIRFSSLFVAWDVSRGWTSTTQRQKFHTDDANQCLHNKSVVMGFQIYWSILVYCCVHLPTSSSKTQILLLEKIIFHKYWLFC